MARKLLTETERPVTDICYETGFSNISNFNRAFLQRIGMTPSRYRRASRSRSLKGHTGETSAGTLGAAQDRRGPGVRLDEHAP
jgi:hypothetical protein